MLADELAALGAAQVSATDGGVGFSGPFTLGYRVCLWSRIASRVLWQLAESEYRHEEEIYRLARNIDWPHLFSARETIRVQVDAIRSPLTSLEFVTLRVKDAIVDRFRAAMASRPSVNTSTPDMRIHVFLTAHKATVYLDLAGEALFKRGYRRGPARRRCARTSPPACWRSRAGPGRCRCSTRCAAAAPSSPRRR